MDGPTAAALAEAFGEFDADERASVAVARTTASSGSGPAPAAAANPPDGSA